MIRSIFCIPVYKLDALNTKHYLTTYDPYILKDLIEILTPFEKGTLLIQGEKCVTSSILVPCIRVLKAILEELSKKYNSKFLTDLIHSTIKRLSP